MGKNNLLESYTLLVPLLPTQHLTLYLLLRKNVLKKNSLGAGTGPTGGIFFFPSFLPCFSFHTILVFVFLQIRIAEMAIYVKR